MAVDYQTQLESFRDSDARRADLVSQLIRELEAVEKQLSETTGDLENERSSRRSWQQKAQDCGLQISKHKQLLNSNNYAVVLVDGDGVLVRKPPKYELGRS